MRATHSGFTLIEVMVVVTVAVILSFVATPFVREFIISQRVKSAAFAMVSTATLARSEAQKRGEVVRLTAASGGDWAAGWTVATASTGVTLANQEALAGVTVTPTGGAVASISYQATGRLPIGTAAPSFTVAGGTSSNQRCVSFDLSGMPVSRMGAC